MRAGMTRGRARALIIPVLLVCALCSTACLADWAQFGSTSANTRATQDDGIGQSNLASMAPTLLGTMGGAVYSSPVVSIGVAYVTADDGTLDAFDANGVTNCSGVPNTCSPLWTASIEPAGSIATSATLSSSPAVSPTVGTGTVFVDTTSGYLEAFDATGTTGCSGSPKVCTPLWTATTGAAITSSPTIAGGVVYVGSTNGTLDAFDATGTTGCSGSPKVCTPLWTATTGGAIHDTPAVLGSTVYVGSGDGQLYAFTTAGALQWTAATGGPITYSSPSVRGSSVYVGSTDGKLYAFTTAGALQWAAATGGPIISSPATTATDVYVGSSDDSLYAFTTAGSLAWRATTGGSVLSSPALSNGLVYVGSSDDHVTAYDSTGSVGCSGTPTVCTPLWSVAATGAVVSSPTVAEGAVWFGSLDGHLYAEKPWTFTAGGCPTNTHAGLSACQLEQAYALPSVVAGSGRTVAIVDAYDDPNAASDLAVYRAQWGLPACTTANGCFTKLNQAGVAGSYPAGNKSWSEEISLDLDTVSAICPRCHITLVEATSSALGNLLTAEQTAAATNPTVLSNSWGTSEFSSEHSYDADVTYAGIPTTFSTGDDGYGTTWPASAPGVTAVGGTVLTSNTSARGWTETVWSGANSGCSAYEAKPVWQTDSGCANRTIADVSALAGSPGEAIYDTYSGDTGWEDYGGTSLASPLIASVYALAWPDSSAAYTYAHTASLYDVTSGSNGSCGGSYLCTGEVGYDGPSGLGTPCGTAAFGTGPYVTATCPSMIPPPTTTTTAGPSAQPALAAPSLVSTPVCGPPTPGYASCDADRLSPSP